MSSLTTPSYNLTSNYNDNNFNLDLNGFGNFGNLNTLGGNGVSGDFITVDTFDITENQILSSVQGGVNIFGSVTFL